MEDLCKLSLLLTFFLITLRSLVDAYPFPESVRYALHRPKAVQPEENYPYGARETGWSGNQYYPPALWADALLQLSETPRAVEGDYADEYNYDVAEPEESYASEGSDSALSEESFKDLLLTYLLRQQELVPRVQRRNEVKPSTSTSRTPAVTSTTVAPTSTFTPAKFEQGQKEVPILRPPSDSRRQPLSWPKELEESSQEDSHSGRAHLFFNKAKLTKATSAPSTKMAANDFLALELDHLKPQIH